MPRRIVIALALAAAALLCIAPAVAGAKAKKKPKTIQVVTATAQSPPTGDLQTATTVAVCPPKTVALSGGFNGPFVFGQTVFFPTESFRASPTSWQASGFVDTNGPGPTITLTVEVYCAKLPGQIVEAQTSGLTQPNIPASGVATCPPKTQLVSGGFTVGAATSSSQYPFVNANHRVDPTSWGAEFVTSSSSKPTTTRAYCFQKAKKKGKKGKKKSKLKAPLPLTELSSTGSLSSSQQSSATATAPACPKKRKTLSGGWQAPPVGPAGSRPSFYESRLAGGAWKLSAEQIGTVAGTFTALAYCG